MKTDHLCCKYYIQANPANSQTVKSKIRLAHKEILVRNYPSLSMCTKYPELEMGFLLRKSKDG